MAHAPLDYDEGMGHIIVNFKNTWKDALKQWRCKGCWQWVDDVDDEGYCPGCQSPETLPPQSSKN